MDELNREKANEALKPLEECQAELQKTKERVLYLQAEFDNYKKRSEKERAGWITTSQDGVLLEVLTIVDDIDRALAEMNALPQEFEAHTQGFHLIAKSLSKLLKKYDIEEITVGKDFNPELSEAVMQVTSAQHGSGEVVAVLQKGYMRHGQVLRPAKVSVAQ